MGRKRHKLKRQVKDTLRERVSRAVADAFPGCTAVFVGQQSRAALVGRTFGFRVRDEAGIYRSNIVWINSQYSGPVTAGWAAHAVANANN
jgi:hypothetical protein